jgi:hypothetical protein|nr:MAG TPA: SicP [Caudoviricetes sp.]
MEIKTKRTPIANESMGRYFIRIIREKYGDNVADKVKLINEISFNTPVYNFCTDEVVFHIPETDNWYLEFPEEVTVHY